MSTLEDKILGEKREYYCSSSESENEEEDSENESENTSKTIEVDTGPPPLNPPDGGGSSNTGPKGVIKDWQTFKQIQAEQRVEREKEKLALIQKLSLTCRSTLDDEKDRKLLEDAELAELLEDPFFLQYSKQRMEEMFKKVSELPKFGTVIDLASGEEFLDAIDKESKSVTIIIHIYDHKVLDCKNMNSYLDELSIEYPEVKFCKLLASAAGVSRHFKVKGIPALLVYKNGTLVGNFVKITEELGSEFSANDVENFLIENGMLLDKTCIPAIIKQSTKNDDDDNDFI